MDRKKFLENLNVGDFKHEEIIDGVRVVHTGLTQYVYDSDGKALPREVLEMYDADGNWFYSNCSSLEEAQKLVEKLKAEGKEAVIGPKAPIISHYSGKPTSNTMKDHVGVYIVKEKEEKEGEKSTEK